MKKTLNNIFIILMFFILTIALGTIKSKAGYLYLNSLDFQTQINNDGSIDILETWYINIEDTNTLYKSFKTDLSKYSEITNVVVKDITSGQDKTIKQMNGLITLKKTIIMERKMKMEILRLDGELVLILEVQ